MTRLKCMKCGKKYYFHKDRETRCPSCGSEESVPVSDALQNFIIIWVILMVIIFSIIFFFFG